VPVVGSGGSELQHVAFACADALATARAMRDRGAPLLDIPRNYYDDLAARTDLEPALIERMSDLGVLYDATDGGELLHFYTEMAGSSMFFEVLERRGGYEGYGAANSPVRMAAQRAAQTRRNAPTAGGTKMSSSPARQASVPSTGTGAAPDRSSERARHRRPRSPG
jgi:4-hydroxyphenylpyruvate dioxygenase